MEEKITLGANGQYPLPAILTLPENVLAPYTAVVLVQGSGPTDKDETIFANKPFLDIANYLAAHGIASLRYDKRTYTYGKQMVKAGAGQITVKSETIDDAIIASELLRSDSRIDPKRIFMLGHSLGGMLAPRIDAEGGNFAGLIIVAGSPRNLSDIILDQNAAALAQMPKLIQKIAAKQVSALKAKFDRMPQMTEAEAQTVKIGGNAYLWYFKEMVDHPIAKYLLAATKPILILQGDQDFQVLPGLDFAQYQTLCANQANVSFKLYPGLNHLFMPSVYGTIKNFKKEYRVPAHVEPQVLADIVAWIKQN